MRISLGSLRLCRCRRLNSSGPHMLVQVISTTSMCKRPLIRPREYLRIDAEDKKNNVSGRNNERVYVDSVEIATINLKNKENRIERAA